MTLHSRRLSILLASASLLAACASNPTVETIAPPPAAAAVAAPAEPVPVTSLVKEVSIPHQKFVLDNGLTVLVHEDRKAPVVGVSMWYNVGSKDEPKGETGFAHLFEHLMFNGTENLPGRLFHLSAADRRDRLQRHDLVRPHQLFRDGPDRRARSRAVHGKRPHGPSARRGDAGRAR